MFAKKNILIILAICVIAFFAVLVIGQPIWMAAVASVGVLLLAAIFFSSRGLILPEGLTRRRGDEETKADSKEDYFDKIEADLRDFSAQDKVTSEEVQWMTEYTSLLKGVGEVIFSVHEGVRAPDNRVKLQAFNNAKKELPALIARFKRIPTDLPNIDSNYIQYQTEGLELYLKGCNLFIKALEASDGNIAGEAALNINKGLNMTGIITTKPAFMP